MSEDDVDRIVAALLTLALYSSPKQIGFKDIEAAFYEFDDFLTKDREDISKKEEVS